jgi:thioredoxin-related protein
MAKVVAGFLAIMAFALGAVPTLAQSPAFAGQTTLLMVDASDCIYCRRWERDIMPGYLNSEEGKIAPLTKRERGHPDLRGISGLAYTPTFVLLENGQEIGRIVGYAGPEFFWGQVDELIKKMKPAAPLTTPTENRADAKIDPRPVALR